MRFSKLNSLLAFGLLGMGTTVLHAQPQASSAATPLASSVIAKESNVSAAGPSQPATASRSEERAKALTANDALPYDYKIGAGDNLQISVWKEPEASANVIVRPDGKISLPLLKEVQVEGLTPVEVEQMITERLTKLITEPDVTVVVTGIRSLKVYVVGAIKTTGPIPYVYQMTIMQAISEAGGLTDYAKRSKIYVLRSDKGKEIKLPFDYDSVLKGKTTDKNIRLLPGDTLVVP